MIILMHNSKAYVSQVCVVELEGCGDTVPEYAISDVGTCCLQAGPGSSEQREKDVHAFSVDFNHTMCNIQYWPVVL
jgi:hypothetical protein